MHFRIVLILQRHNFRGGNFAMAWTYSDYTTLSGAARLARLQFHIKEVSDRLTENYSIQGRSKQVDPLQKYLDTLKTEEDKMGGSGPRAEGRSRVLRADFKEPQGVD